MTQRMVGTTVFLILAPERRNGRVWGVRVTGVRKAAPKGQPYVRLGVVVPAAAFEPFWASANITVNELGFDPEQPLEPVVQLLEGPPS